MKPPERIEVKMDDLEEILERARTVLSPDDHGKLKAAVETLNYLTHELEAKRVAVGRLKKLLFGPKSEKTEDVLGKERGTAAAGEGAGEQNTADREEKKPKGHGRNSADEYEGAERIKVAHPSLKPGDPCPKSNCKGRVYRQKKPRLLLRILGQAPVKAKVFELERLRCNLCGEVFSAEAPEGIGEEKYDPTAASMIALLKYGSGLPFNRLEGLEGNLGIPLPASTQWDIVNDKAKEVFPGYAELIRQAAQGDILFNDDTTAKILEWMGKRKARSASGESERTGIFTSGIVSTGQDRRIALFFTGRRHAGENLAMVLAKRARELGDPIQMCDALSRNTSKEFKTIVANCLAHGRRQFVDLSENFPEECQHVLEALRVVYQNEDEAQKQGLSPEERLRFHREHSRPVMVRLRLWFREQFAKRLTEPNSSLGEAIKYMTKHWLKLTRFYRRAGAPLDNNIAERSLKRVILHRKNSLFFRSERGARVGDIFMTLIYTAELSGQNPFEYLTELQRHKEDLAANPAKWMPWSYRERLAALRGSPTERS